MSNEIIKMTVQVEAVRFPAADVDERKRAAGEGNLFYIFEYHTEEGASGKAKGELSFRPKENERLELQGNYTVWNGERQFKFNFARPYIPTDERSVLAYACELTEGFGPATEEKIWELMGTNWRDVEAGAIKGLTATKIEHLRQTIEFLDLKMDETKAIAFLLSKGASLTMAQAAVTAWKKDTIATVNDDCFKLADLPHFGFSHVDGEIRLNFGVADNDPRRLAACVRYCMNQLTDRGDTLVPWYLLRTELLSRLGGVGVGAIEDAVKVQIDKGLLVYFQDRQEFALRAHFDAELAIFMFAQEAIEEVGA